ncbi:hypothetical protein [Paraburkholderia haematera]|uniref:Uncharacterized protein n=1 Tax=Paraburkholderia haematera TaxID=2793077 RepID=A0ABN7KE36_9BURK|nr:hypothetical protein [Paraburkholderia haematera]CAE6687965.1 hypothetical protein R69888_00077 [Paraburkholderia haematera]
MHLSEIDPLDWIDQIDLDDKEPDSDSTSKKAIHQFMMYEWTICFRKNADFKAYCDAKRSGDAEMCSVLEAKHVRIAELYEDWGDIHVSPEDDPESLRLLYSLATNPLFALPEAEKSGVALWSRLQKSDHAALVKIPKGLRKEQLLEVLADFVEENPDILGDGPKYEIGQIKGKSREDVLKLVRRASLAYKFLTDMRPEGVSTKAMAEKFIQQVVDDPEARSMLGLNWRIHGELNQQLFEQGKRSADEIKNYTRTLTNLNDFYAACIEGTIRGTFPSNMKT